MKPKKQPRPDFSQLKTASPFDVLRLLHVLSKINKAYGTSAADYQVVALVSDLLANYMEGKDNPPTYTFKNAGTAIRRMIKKAKENNGGMVAQGEMYIIDRLLFNIE